ncbi:protein 4.1-like isoform X8 [Engystomops pustulosus]|uniref:protein 4.1-like isoform X8 n=1 Tax=Engystomops pustulosus TaxID=76066 RepID=UPI003AFACCE7
MNTLMTSVSIKMTTEKSVVAEAESPPQDQKPEGKEQEEEGASKSIPEETSTENKQEIVETQDSNSTASPGTRKNKDRNSEGKRLSRLFSSFLKRPKSQVTEEDKDLVSPSEKGIADQKELDEGLGENLDDEVFLKAPIAAPEPELRTDPSLDLHSLSSAETQPAQEDRKDDQDAEANPEDEEDTVDVDSEQKLTKTEEVKSPQKVVRRSGKMRCKVMLLDDTVYECELEKHAKGQDIFKKVCSHLNILEEDYFGLAIWESPTNKTWIDPLKDIRKQVHGAPWDFTFNVKFYPPDPAQLTEDITRYYLCLQLRQDILSGRLPCSFATLALLGSYTVQSEVGDYDEDLHGTDYVSEFKLSPNQTKDLEAKVAELHKSYRSMTPAQADLEFLENAKKLTMYGVDIHQAKDLEGVDIKLGVCSSGLMVFKDNLRINRFPWPKVLKISYKRSSFFIKIRPGEQEQYESTIGFKLPSYRAAKKLWKVCVEHHTFFRLTSTETIPKHRFLSLGSKFRYSGRTQAQTRHASALIDRPAPQFERTASKRATRSLDGAAVATPERNPRPVSAPVITQSQVVVQPIPSREITARKIEESSSKNEDKLPQDQLKEPKSSSKEAKTPPQNRSSPTVNGDQVQQPAEKEEEIIRMRKKRAKKLEGENIYIRHSNLMLEDLEKTQDEIIRHHASIRELKKSFMESVPAPRPSEWDKRLSSHSPFRTLSFNGQVQTGNDGVKRALVLPTERKVCGSEPPLVKTKTVTISNTSVNEKGQIPTKEVPLVHTETKTITYEAAKNEDINNDQEPGILLTAHTITSETTSSTTTTQITKTVKGGISETRIEKRIVITGDGDLDHDQVLVQAIKEAKEQHPDMSVTKVVVHQETEIAEE